MINLIHKSLLQYFGLNELGTYSNKTFKEFRDDVVDAVVNNQMLLIPGEFGAGKTFLFEAAQSYLSSGTRFVRTNSLEVERLTIGGIINAAIYDLSNEGPKRDLEARSRQFTRIVGKIVCGETSPQPSPYKGEGANPGETVCIVIEDAHLLNKHTLKALKTLREARFAGRWPLFSLVLIGQWEMMEKVSKRKEVSWRTVKVQLDEDNGWMTPQERIKFIESLFGDAVSSGARKTIASVCSQPLQIVQYVRDKMKAAKKAGYKVVNSDVVNPTLLELYSAAGRSTREIEKATGIAQSTVYTAVHTGIKDEGKVKVIRNYLLKCLNGGGSQEELFKKSA
jgi:type II secretory pathway predicted ATPase ExeA